jgi:translocation and assembly module TamB
MVPYLQGMKKLTMVDEIKLETGDEYDSYSLVLGSWLTPDFYVSYGKDLAKDSISFNTRYTLGKGFHFLTETGSAHSGGDIKYEFER